MFRVERHDIVGDRLSTWDSFGEANAEYERQVDSAMGYVGDEATVALVVVLRHATIPEREKGTGR